jgi:uncharacterized repeat protein (TIGR02543 family)
MKANITIWAIILTMVVSVNNVNATYVLTDDDVEVVDGILESCSYDYADKDIVIPEILDEQTIIGIANSVFYLEYLTSVELPSTIETIGNYAFYQNNFTSITLPNSLKEIGLRAFCYNAFSSITIPDSVKTIDEYAFQYNPSLTSVTFESSSHVLSIGTGAFRDCNAGLVSITLPISTYSGFLNYKNDLHEIVTQIDDFFKAYYTNVQYTLTDDDVVVRNGVIDSCSYNFDFKNIIIPEILDRQIVKRVANGSYIGGVFYNKGITDLVLPESLEVIGDYSFSKNVIRSVVIPESVTTIGEEAFSNNELESLVIPNSVTTIETEAFQSNVLTSLSLSNSLTTIESSAFKYNELTSITIPNSIEYINNNAFSYNSIDELIIPNSVKSIEASAFLNNLLDNVIFESNSNIMSIKYNAFAGNTSLISIELPTHANSNFTNYVNATTSDEYLPGETISDFAKSYYAVALYILADDDVVVTNGVIESCSVESFYKNIEIPEILDGQTVKGIADGGIFQNRELVKIVLPATLEVIGTYAFDYNDISDLTLPNAVISVGSSAFRNNSIENLVLSNSLTYIGSNAFYGNDIDSLIIPSSVGEIGNSAFYSNTIDSLFIPSSIIKIESSAFRSNSLTKVIFENNSNIKLIGNYAFAYNSGLEGVILPINNNPGFKEYVNDDDYNVYNPDDTITNFNITYYAHIPYTLTDDDVVVTNGIIESCNYNHAEYKSIIIPEVLDGQTVIGIGDGYNYDGVFRSKELIGIQLPATLQLIGAGAFQYNDISEINLPEAVTSIGEYAFSHNKLKEVSIPDSLEIINEGVFLYNSLDSITIPNSITIIGESAFKGNDLTKVIIPNSVISIGAYAFIYNNIDSLILPNSLTVINYGTFRDNSLTKVIIPNSVTNIDGSAFQSNYIDTLVIPNGVTNIGYNAFSGNNLVSVVFPESVTTIDNYAFNSNNLDTIIIPNSVTHIGERAFYLNSLDSVIFENNSNIIQIGKNAFASNGSLAAITMPTHSHPDFIAYVNESNGDVYNPGEIINDFTVIYESNIPYALTDNDVVVIDGVIQSCSYDFHYKNIIIPDTLDNQEIIGIASASTSSEGIFSQKGLLSVELPDSLNTIGDYAFYYNSLQNLLLPDSITSIGVSAFYNNNLMSVNFPNSLKNIGKGAFAYNKLSSINIPDSVIIVEDEAFRNNSLTSVTLGSSVTNINYRAFINNFLLENLIISNGVEYIGVDAFNGSRLNSITIPVSVKTIEENAFYNNDLNEVIFIDNSYISYIGKNAFSINSLTNILLPPNHADPNFIEYKKGDGTIVTEITEFTDFYYANIPYELTDEDVIVTEGMIDTCTYDFVYKNIIIPETLDGQAVIGISDGGVFKSKDIVSVQLPTTLEYIGSHAFSSNNIASLNIGSNVEIIGDSAFSSNSLVILDIPDAVISIGASSFCDNDIDNLTLGNSVQIISDSAFYQNFINELTLPNSLLVIDGEAFYQNSIDTLIIPNSVTKVGNYAFYSNNMRELTLGNSLDTIGEGAFKSNILQVISLPNSIITIEDEAFYGNPITNVNLGNSIQNIGAKSFYGSRISNISLPNSLVFIGSEAFRSNYLVNVTVPSSVKTIDDFAFYNNNIQSFTFENNSDILYIGTEAFNSNSYYFESINLPTHAHPDFIAYYNSNGDEVDVITDFDDFYYVDIPYTLTNDDVVVIDGVVVSCSYDFTLKNIIIPQILDGQVVTGIGDSEHYTCVFCDKGITKIQLPATLNNIGDNSFADNAITDLTIPNSVTQIGEYAFSDNDIESVNIPNSIIKIGHRAFAYNKITNITIPKSIRFIDYAAFYYCELSSVNFENNSNLSYIEYNAFGNNSSLTNIQLPTNANPGFNGYVTEDGVLVTEITDFYERYFADFPYTLKDDDVVVVDGYITSYDNDIVYSNIVIPNTLDGQTIIGIADGEQGSYYDPDICTFCDKNLKSVEFPSTLEYIGDMAFLDNYLEEVVIPNSVIIIGEEAFSYNRNTKNLTLGNSVVTIRDYAFNSNEIEKLEIPNSVKNIGNGAFRYNEIDSLIIPNTVFTIGDRAFYRNNLKYVNFEENSNISFVDIYAFHYNSLMNIQLPTHASSNFTNYTDGSSNPYNEGDLITNFTTSYSTEIAPYTVTFKNYDGTILSTLMVTHGENVTAPDVPERTGYIFDGWDSDFNIIISDMEIIAQYIRINNITYNLDGGTNSDNNPSTYLITDNTIVFTNATKANCYFDGWFTEPEFTNQITEIPQGSEGDVEFWAKFSIITYNITYNLDAGINNVSNPVSYSNEDEIIFEDPNKNGYVFNGWFLDSDFNNAISNIPLGSTGNIAIWAKFTRIDYSINYQLDGGVNSALNPSNYRVNKKVLFYAATKPYYNFEGWFTDVAFINQINEIGIGSTGDTTIYAKFSIQNYNLTYNLNGGTNSNDNPGSYTVESDTIILNNAEKEGYIFDGWYSDSYFITEITEIPKGSVGSISLYAKFNAIEYSIFYHNSGEHSNLGLYTITDSIILSDAVKTGYEFNGWYTDEGFVNEITKIEIGSTGDKNIYAQFVPVNYIITYELNGGINGISNPYSYTIESDTIILANAEKDGYTFEGWYINSNFIERITEIPKGTFGEIQLYAKFVLKEYSIIYHNGGEHSNPISYTSADSTIIFSDAVKTGYEFIGWYIDTSFTNLITEIISGSTGDIELYAQFSPINYTITYKLNGGVNSIANPDNYTIESELIILEDPYKEGYTFNGWYTDSEYTIPIYEISQGSTGNLELFAWFTINTYNVTFYVSDGAYVINNAYVYFEEVIYPTDLGVASIDNIINGTYNYTVRASGFYDSVGTVSINENDVSLNIILNYIGTGISENDYREFRIYPNPVSENLFIEFKNGYNGKIDIYSLTGLLLKNVEAKNTEVIEINTSDIHPGIYFLKIDNKIFKLIKE